MGPRPTVAWEDPFSKFHSSTMVFCPGLGAPLAGREPSCAPSSLGVRARPQLSSHGPPTAPPPDAAPAQGPGLQWQLCWSPHSLVCPHVFAFCHLQLFRGTGPSVPCRRTWAVCWGGSRHLETVPLSRLLPFVPRLTPQSLCERLGPACGTAERGEIL